MSEIEVTAGSEEVKLFCREWPRNHFEPYILVALAEAFDRYRLATEQATEQASDKLTVEWLRKFGCPDYFRVGVERGEHRKGT